jgi:phosphatidylinositol-3-phosphatase
MAPAERTMSADLSTLVGMASTWSLHDGHVNSPVLSDATMSLVRQLGLGLFVAGALALTFTACGAGGSSTSNDGGTGGHSGSGGHGGASGSAGAAGHGGSAGSSGSGGSRGSAGTAGKGGGPDGSADSASDSGGMMFAPGTVCNKSGTKLTPPTTVAHVIVFMFENQNLGSVVGSRSAPYMNQIATDCAYATNYSDNCFSTNLVSCPHYLALTSGSNCDTGLGTTGTGCITTDDDATSNTLSTTSIFAQVSSWKAYEESMPTNCDPSTSGLYAPKHNPASYYSTLASCSANDIPIAPVTCGTTAMTACGTPSNAFTTDLTNDTLPAFAFVTPNLDNDMHNGLIESQQVAHGDNWLFTYLPLVLSSKAYLSGQVAVFVLWDEQDSLTFGGPTPNIFVSPYIGQGTVATTQVNHFASLLAFETMLGIPTHLGCAGGTPPGGTGTCPTGSTADLRSAINF